jgi:hypothetical protein
VRAQQASGWGRCTTVIDDINQRALIPEARRCRGSRAWRPNVLFWAEVAGRGEGLEQVVLGGVSGVPGVGRAAVITGSREWPAADDCQTRRAPRASGSQLWHPQVGPREKRYGLPCKLSKQAGLSIKRLDLFNQCGSHRLHPIKNLSAPFLMVDELVFISSKKLD